MHGLNPILVTYLQTEVQINLVVTLSALGRTDAVADMTAVLFKPFIESKADVDHADNLPVIFPNQKEFPCRHSHFVRYHEVVCFRRPEPALIILEVMIQSAGTVNLRAVLLKFFDICDCFFFSFQARNFQIKPFHVNGLPLPFSSILIVFYLTSPVT